MTEAKEPEDKKSLSLGASRRPLGVKKTVETGQVRQSFSHGRSKAVTVEVRKKRTIGAGTKDKDLTAAAAPVAASTPTPTVEAPKPAAQPEREAAPLKATAARSGIVLKQLTDEEKEARRRALDTSIKAAEENRRRAEEEGRRRVEEEARLKVEHEAARKRLAEEEARKKHDEEVRRKAEGEATRRMTPEEREAEAKAKTTSTARPSPSNVAPAATRTPVAEEDERPIRRGAGVKVAVPAKPATTRGREEPRRRGSRLTLQGALNEEERVRSIASYKRAIARERRLHQNQPAEPPKKVVRDVILPEMITVQELANRMAERGVDLIKALMKMGVMATINQTIDADTAELLVNEFGHRMKRVTEHDVEIGLATVPDVSEDLKPRAPVVTIMGHVDHGKTSLLDALRATDVVAGEAGGITQHIGAYQVALASGARITFLDTPGHEAFTAMRARGAKVTDLVVLVVAADDSVMPQTIEAIRHAKAAQVPLIVAINKIDKPEANPQKVKQQLLSHEIVVEDMGGETLCVEVSAKNRLGLDKLEEAILLQAEVLELRANPARAAEGAVVEAKLDRGRGSVATILVQRGTLKVGDIFVAGSEWGRVRALIDDHGKNVTVAGPSSPVEVLGWQGTPEAGDDFIVVETEAKAREVAEFRQRRQRDARNLASGRGTLEQMFTKIKAGEMRELPVVVKADVQGSLEAIIGAAQKIGTEEVGVRLLHGAVGGINESDITLARASGGMIIGFNVRANKQARDMANRDGVDIRYYSIIYDVTDDLKQMLSGMLAPTLRESFLGYAEIREIFNITKVGKVAGCMVTEGQVKRGAKVRLLRDNVVIHEGTLSTLKRFKDEVREVKAGTECGMAFENYHDIQVGDVIECFEVEQVARVL